MSSAGIYGYRPGLNVATARPRSLRWPAPATRRCATGAVRAAPVGRLEGLFFGLRIWIMFVNRNGTFGGRLPMERVRPARRQDGGGELSN